jgi:hypothetical protein
MKIVAKTSPDEIFQSQIGVMKFYSLVALVYTFFFSVIYVVEKADLLLIVVHVFTAFLSIWGAIALFYQKNYWLFIHLMLVGGSMVIFSLFITGGWGANSGYLYPIAYLPYPFFLAPRKTSIYWTSVIYVSTILSTILHFVGIIHLPYSNNGLINYFFALGIFSILMFSCQKKIFTYETILERNKITIQKNEEDFQAINKKLDLETKSHQKLEKSFEEQSQKLEKMNNTLLNREITMIELKKEIERLKLK